MKITKDKRSLLPNAGMEYMQRLLHHSAFLVAVREANEKARQELKTSTVDFCPPEQFDAISSVYRQGLGGRNFGEELGLRK